ncbi:2-C-methyl-D-erythritol 4-phosphate cytidylyltransferase [Fodinibius salinus]|uniref:2-C-methyl-D-erythritol 4-phosphate cytidylyltransferase n=1 Tax=Fodinibius salinus TaxID=860790 RepID=A0A5D3YPM2_9BACT|nr:2-C-methyl-D-erythritol 4-phosphate cytidylyltransferase [Fodinibius salinus]TYP94129.1 2-C-methyl-D-erythritol 4-phosphate cytidylyltransferase [Fodinibius salinus]
MTSKALIIPAAGSGSRLGTEIPKPYLRLAGQTILHHSISRFLSLDGLSQVVIATSPQYIDRSEEILDNLLPASIVGICVEGGTERQDSITNALNKVGDVGLVMVHDAVRPFVNEASITECCKVASKVGSAVLGIPAKDTIKRIDEEQYVQETPPRKLLWQTQTPQVFQKQIIMEAYEQAASNNIEATDDASLVERLGKKIKMVEGNRSNIKITYPLDLQLAKQLINNEQ